MKHGEPPNRCAWCLKWFPSRRALKAHERAKHRSNMPRNADEELEAKMQHYHQDKMAAGK